MKFLHVSDTQVIISYLSYQKVLFNIILTAERFEYL